MVAAYTVLGPTGVSRPPYSSFAGKEEAAASPGGPHPVGLVSVLGPVGVSRPPWGNFAGKEESTPVPPPPPPPAAVPGSGGGHGQPPDKQWPHDKPWPIPIYSVADYFGHADEIKAQVRREVAVQVAAPQRPPTPAKAKRLALGILDGYVAQIPRGSPAEAKKLRAALAALRRDIQAYAAALAEQRAADDEEDDIIGILLN